MYLPGNLIRGSCSFGDYLCHICDIVCHGKAFACRLVRRNDEHREFKLRPQDNCDTSNDRKAERYDCDLFAHNAKGERAKILWI